MDLNEKFTYMATGQPYDDLDPKLVALRAQATATTQQLNAEVDPNKRVLLFAKLVGKVGSDPMIEPNFRCEFGRNIQVGDYFYANYDCVMLDGAPITIGTHVLLGPKVGLYTSNHLFDPTERQTGGCIAKPITVGDNVWIAANVTVLPGVKIGNNSIIGGGSVVTRDIPANVIAAGNPCRVLRKITAADRTGFDGHDLSAK
ncbi:sugar O-acetyltransferase [Lentilactobacillus kisonensis]|uniref:Acetyltransferase n=2 Tax=Lentilactobacillus kisonensis TaxID=481722 RepID=H1LDW9_9LACO|nr:sugar O-acetyltransferase [Lentilactobacillus kisonensis]EHO52963.1 putative maltose O-acetyltransferase [Lentilactobacillus kisonensis F0435]KRL22745.1 maltose O-acetyltransferase [Lentilactobacillus kisonensis DSM 19906 = JCM 15041]